VRINIPRDLEPPAGERTEPILTIWTRQPGRPISNEIETVLVFGLSPGLVTGPAAHATAKPDELELFDSKKNRLAHIKAHPDGTVELNVRGQWKPGIDTATFWPALGALFMGLYGLDPAFVWDAGNNGFRLMNADQKLGAIWLADPLESAGKS